MADRYFHIEHPLFKNGRIKINTRQHRATRAEKQAIKIWYGLSADDQDYYMMWGKDWINVWTLTQLYTKVDSGDA